MMGNPTITPKWAMSTASDIRLLQAKSRGHGMTSRLVSGVAPGVLRLGNFQRLVCFTLSCASHDNLYLEWWYP